MRRGRRGGGVAWNYTLLGSGEPAVYTDAGVSIFLGNNEINPAAVGDGLLEDVTGQYDKPVGMPPYLGNNLAQPTWINVNSPDPSNEINYIHTYTRPVFLRQFYFTLNTSAIAGTRNPVIVVRDENNQRVASAMNSWGGAVASISHDFQFNGEFYRTSLLSSYPPNPIEPFGRSFIETWLPPIYLKYNWRLTTETHNLKAGDIFSGIKLMYFFV